jgi:hypothetical protein
MQVANVKQSSVCHGRGKAYNFGAGTSDFYNLQHKDYDNNLVKIITGRRLLLLLLLLLFQR